MSISGDEPMDDNIKSSKEESLAGHTNADAGIRKVHPMVRLDALFEFRVFNFILTSNRFLGLDYMTNSIFNALNAKRDFLRLN